MSKRQRTRSKSRAVKGLLPSGSPSGQQQIKMADLKPVSLTSPPHWVDHMELAVRADIPIATIRFYAICPPFIVESSRLQTSVDHLKKIVDVLSKSLNYYPSKAKEA